jgi:NADH-quinone oxidoreductase subunit A
MTEYLPILVFIVFGILLGAVALTLGAIISPHAPNVEKLSPYECGFPGVGDARLPFDVRYYLVAILFIVFDLETAFLFPWAVALREIGWEGFISMAIFIGLLLLGFIYEWRKGALEWN